MVKYEIFDRKKAYKHGLNKAFLRTVPTKRAATTYTGGQTGDYIIKKIGKPKRRKKK